MKKAGIWLCILMLSTVLPLTALGAASPEVAIPVTVVAEGGGADPAAVYAVELIPKTPGCPMPEGGEAGKCAMELTSGETRYICMPCCSLGVYDYTVRQRQGDIPDCIYDSRTYRLRLILTAGTDGTPEPAVLIYDQEDSKQPEILFRNRWPDPVAVNLKALKTLDGETPADGRFSFRLLKEDGTLVEEQKNTGRNITFSPLYFDREGIYTFYLKEAAGKEEKIQYDRTVYTVTVKIKDGQAQVSYLRNGKPYTGTPAFANYTDTGSPKTGDPIGRWVAVLAVSSAGLAMLLKRRRQ